MPCNPSLEILSTRDRKFSQPGEVKLGLEFAIEDIGQACYSFWVICIDCAVGILDWIPTFLPFRAGKP